nr:MAG TPA: Protein of unknown function (DUF551) [Caudoviricetes sp.]
MIHIKDRLMQYEDEYSKYRKYDGLYVADVLEMLEQLQDDLEQDEKENGWIPVSERLPDPDKYIAISFDNCDIPAIGRYTVDDEGGGTFRVGDQDESFLELNLFISAWMPLPESCNEGPDE